MKKTKKTSKTGGVFRMCEQPSPDRTQYFPLCLREITEQNKVKIVSD